MKESYASIVSLRRRVFSEIAKMAYADTPLQELASIGPRI